MKFKKPNFNFKREKKGQSLIELTMVLVLLLTLLTGMVEFGNLLNQYVNIVDGAREGARFGSNYDPFIRVVTAACPTPPCYNLVDQGIFTSIDQIIEGATDDLGNRDPQATGAIAPLKLNPLVGDDVVISFFGISNGKVLRFPAAFPYGYSYYLDYKKMAIPRNKSQFSDTALQARMVSGAPDTGMLLVEIFYHYNQLLKFYKFLGLPDPISLSTYAIMPLSAAEPTPTVVP